MVAEVRSITRQTTSTAFKLDDGTGTIEGRYWNDTERPTHDDDGNPISQDLDAVSTGDWARVLGQIKFISNKRFISIQNIKKVTDKNEINYHLLEATYVYLYLTKGPPESLQSNGDAGAMQGLQTGYGQASTTNDNLKNVSGVAKRVYQRLLQDQSHEGVHLDLVARELNLDYAQVKRAAEELYNENKAFNTVDDDTYAVLQD